MLTIAKDAASVPPRLYVNESPSSSSVAVIALPIFVPAAVFSATDRVMSVSAAITGASLTSVTLIVTEIVSVPLPSDTMTLTVYAAFVSWFSAPLVLSCPVLLSIANTAASVPLSRYASVFSSASVAAIGVPMFSFDLVFSATERVVLVPSVNTGGVLEGVSSRFVTVIFTVIVSSRLPSETVTTTV